MEDTLRNIKLGVTGLAGALTAVFGWMGWLVLLWAGCMGADYLTGTLAAARAGQWSSQKARDGLWHKAGMFFVAFTALVLDSLISLVARNLPVVNLPFEYRFLLTPLVLCWYVVTELGSIAENALAMGPPARPFCGRPWRWPRPGWKPPAKAGKENEPWQTPVLSPSPPATIS